MSRLSFLRAFVPFRAAAIGLSVAAAAMAPGPALIARPQDPIPAPFAIVRSDGGIAIESPAAGVRVDFEAASGRFRFSGPGFGALQSASVRFRSAGTPYTFPTGLAPGKAAVAVGNDSVGAYAELSVPWKASDSDRTAIVTTARLYQGLSGIVFGETFPAGAKGIGTGRFERIGCAFPVFEPPSKLPAGSRWCSYTYQDWPRPIRGVGWPVRLAKGMTPYPDDGIRTPLVLVDGDGNTATVSPLDNPLQQIAGLDADPSSLEASYTTENPPPRGTTGLPPAGEPNTDSVTPNPEDRNAAILVGPEGKLDDLPPGAAFHSVLMFGRSGAEAGILDWGGFVQKYNGKLAHKAPDDMVARTLGYWTDNGAAYYYHTQGNASYPAMLEAVHAYHTENHIPVRYYQLDSWWYPKGTDGGTVLWSANNSVLPDGLLGLSKVLGSPLALHNRYWSASSPYLEKGHFSSESGPAVPLSEAFYDSLFRTVTASGCRLYEQDWLATQFRKVDALQTRYGAPDAWLNAMDAAALRCNLPVQFCMPSIGFYLASTQMPSVTEIRTSQDFGRDRWDTVRIRWMEHCNLSLLARALGLAASKDVLLTSQAGTMKANTWEEVEALLAILSHGPVGIGDAFGYTDLDLVGRLALEDGTLVQPDDAALPPESAVLGKDSDTGPLAIQATSTVDGQTWRYLMTIYQGYYWPPGSGPTTQAATEPAATDMGPGTQQAPDTIAPGMDVPPTETPVPATPAPEPTTGVEQPGLDAAPTTALFGPIPGSYVCYDYMRQKVLGTMRTGGVMPLELTDDAYSYTILAPVQANGLALIGDVSHFVTASASRFAEVQPILGGLSLSLSGPAGSHVRLAVFSPHGKPALWVDDMAVPIDTRPPQESKDPTGISTAGNFGAGDDGHGHVYGPNGVDPGRTARWPGPQVYTPPTAPYPPVVADPPSEGLYFFDFNLPDSATRGPVGAVLKSRG